MRPLNSKPFVGRKKSSVARCNLYEHEVLQLEINGKEAANVVERLKERFLGDSSHPYLYRVWVKGGGISSQEASAVKSVVRGYVALHPETKKDAKRDPYIWFDPRRVERKKPGRRKARRAQQ